MIIATFLIVINLNYHICIFENMGVATTKPHPIYDVAPRSPLLKFVEITTAQNISINLIVF